MEELRTDLAGNSVSRAFDRDLAASADEPVQARTVSAVPAAVTLRLLTELKDQ